MGCDQSRSATGVMSGTVPPLSTSPSQISARKNRDITGNTNNTDIKSKSIIRHSSSNDSEEILYLNATDWCGFTPLMRAAGDNQVALMRRLISRGADINRCGTSGRVNAVVVAACEGNLEAVKLLAEMGAYLGPPCGNAPSPLFKAAEGGHIEVVNLLLDLGVDADVSPVGSPAYAAARFGHVDVVRTLAEHGGDIHAAFAFNMTPVFAAAYGGHVDVIRVLISLGADVNICSKFGESPVDTAENQGHKKAASCLVNYGACIANSKGQVSLGSPTVKQILEDFCERTSLPSDAEVFSLFSLTKLMLSVIAESNCLIDDDAMLLIETAVGIKFKSWLGVDQTRMMCVQFSYPWMRRICNMAWQICEDSWSFIGGSRVTIGERASRYVEIVSLFFNRPMLDELCCLRLTCKANSELRRFPFKTSVLEGQLEANMVEQFIAYDSCRFISTHDVLFVLKHYSAEQ